VRKKKILIVDDFIPLLEDVTEFLEMEDFSVVMAKNGAEGIQKAIRNDFDLIICDIEMPYINGLELFKILKEIPEKSNIPFIFLTARAQPEDFRAGLRLGADDYITKPFELDELLDSIRLRMEKSEQKDPLAEQKFMTLFNVPHQAVFLYGKNRFTAVNAFFEKITGYNLKEINQIDFIESVQVNKEAVKEAFNRCSEIADESADIKLSFITKAKQHTYIQLFLKNVAHSEELNLIGSFIPYEPAAHNLDVTTHAPPDVKELLEYFNDGNNKETAGRIIEAYKQLGFSSYLEKEQLKKQIALSNREKEVLQLICAGYTNKEISEKLFISPRTVDNHRANVLLKTETKNTAALVAFAVKNHLIC
jgi:DNA-binding NarL/FixJ family response regulator